MPRKPNFYKGFSKPYKPPVRYRTVDLQTLKQKFHKFRIDHNKVYFKINNREISLLNLTLQMKNQFNLEDMIIKEGNKKYTLKEWVDYKF